MLIGLILEGEPIQDRQVTYWVSVSIDHLEGGVQSRLLLLLLICLTYDEIVDFVHV